MIRPKRGDRWVQGHFKPVNPKKYVGDARNITFRSSWELRVMSRLDTDPNVVSWASEEVTIRYLDPSTKKWRRYFPDFLVKYADGKVRMIEVKPASQQERPIKGRKKQERFLAEAATYLTNQAKWEAARAFCADKGWEFVVLNEHDLGIKPRRR